MRRLVALAALCLALSGCDSLGLGGDALEGSFSGAFVETYHYTSLLGGGSFTCVVTYDLAGEIKLELEEPGGTRAGSVQVEWTESIKSKTGNGCGGEGSDGRRDMGGDLSGTPDDFEFSQTNSSEGAFKVDTRLQLSGERTEQGVRVTITLTRNGNGRPGPTTDARLSASGTWTVMVS